MNKFSMGSTTITNTAKNTNGLSKPTQKAVSIINPNKLHERKF